MEYGQFDFKGEPIGDFQGDLNIDGIFNKLKNRAIKDDGRDHKHH